MTSVETTVVIGGMSCGGCVASLTRVLKSVPGIEPLEIEVGKAHLRIDTMTVTPEVLAAAVTRAGFSIVTRK
jgi:copper chaperone CopZ